MHEFLEACASLTIFPLLVLQAAGQQMAQAFRAGPASNTNLLTLANAMLREVPKTPAPRKGVAADLYVGKNLSKTKVMSDLHTLLFGLVSQDFNPLHFHEDAAQASRFRGRITHGMHTASLFSGVLAELTPWCAYLHQEVDFLAPVRPDEVVTADGIIDEISDRGVVQVALTARNARGEIVARGRAVVKQLKEMYESGAAGPELRAGVTTA